MTDHLPKKIAIVGIEKHGGRTTFASSFFSTDTPAVYVDCDMQTNHVFQRLPSGRIGETLFRGTPHAEIDVAKCSQCMQCVHTCRYKAIFINPEGVPEVDRYSCEACFTCARICPEKAVIETAYSGGKWISSYAGSSILVGAKLATSEKNNADYIFQLGAKASKMAIRENKPCVIVDGPAGECLPVLAAITGASLVIIVAEPSWRTFEHFNTIISLVNGLKTPAALIINKADLNRMVTHQLKALALKNKIELLAEIPFDTKLQEGESPENNTKIAGSALETMKEIWESIVQELQ